MLLASAQLTNKAFTDAGKGRIRQSLTALVHIWKIFFSVELETETVIFYQNELHNEYRIKLNALFPKSIELLNRVNG